MLQSLFGQVAGGQALLPIRALLAYQRLATHSQQQLSHLGGCVQDASVRALAAPVARLLTQAMAAAAAGCPNVQAGGRYIEHLMHAVAGIDNRHMRLRVRACNPIVWIEARKPGSWMRGLVIIAVPIFC